MSDSTIGRRSFLTAGAAGLASGLVTAVPQAEAAEGGVNACGGLARERFQEYLTLFNNNDPRFIEFYHDDVVLELTGTEIRTPQGIHEFYKPVKEHLKETVSISHFVSDATGIAVEMPTEFRCVKDWGPEGFFKRPLKVGEVMRTVSFVLYWVQDGKFRHIKSAHYRQVNDWRMEG